MLEHCLIRDGPGGCHGIVLPGWGPGIAPSEGFVIEDEEVIDDKEREDKAEKRPQDKLRR